MSRNEKILCVIYAIVAVVALYATWVNNLAFMAEPENRSAWAWVEGGYVNHAAASITNDLFFLAGAVCIFIAVEGRRLKIRFWWAYILFSSITAIAFTFPLFLIARQMKLAEERVV